MNNAIVKNLFYVYLLSFTLGFSGCISSPFAQRRITKTELSSSREAAAVKERSASVVHHSQTIQSTSKKTRKDLKIDESIGKVAPETYERTASRLQFIEGEAKQIENKGLDNIKSSRHIISINDGQVQLTWWGKLIIVGIVSFFVLGLLSWLTLTLKQWGLLKGIRMATEGTAELVGKKWLIDDRTENSHMSPYMFEKAVDRQQKKA